MVNEYGITYNGRHSSEFGLAVLDDKKIGFPAKNKILVSIPHTSIKHDFSEISGAQPYSERDFTVTFTIIDKTFWNKESMYETWTRTVNWLMQPNTKVPLTDDLMSRYYFLAEVQKEPSLSEIEFIGRFSVTFTCYAFRISTMRDFIGFWDPFDLVSGIYLDSYFQINTNTEIAWINNGMQGVQPKLYASSAMTIEFDNKIFNIPAGLSSSSELILKSGYTKLLVSGNGTLQITTNSEVI